MRRLPAGDRPCYYQRVTSAGERLMLEALLARGVPERHIQTEYRFTDARRWRSDISIWAGTIRSPHIIIEIEGGVGWGQNSRHTSPAGFARDIQKYNAIAALGMILLRATSHRHVINEVAKLAADIYKRVPIDDDYIASNLKVR